MYIKYNKAKNNILCEMINNKLEQIIIYIAIYYICKPICAAYWWQVQGVNEILSEAYLNVRE
jgi:hypothetical protein